MNKTTLILGFSLFFSLNFSSCQSGNKNETVVSDDVFEVDEHSAQNALDYWGTYSGTLPCADCEGIETEIELRQDNTYTKKATYIGKSNDVLESSGTFSWNNEGNSITLLNEDEPNQYFVEENVLFHLDKEGNRITGNQADRYRLEKE